MPIRNVRPSDASAAPVLIRPIVSSNGAQAAFMYRLQKIQSKLLPYVHAIRMDKERKHIPLSVPLKVRMGSDSFSFGVRIGKGAMGEIFLGFDDTTGEAVVMKRILPGLAADPTITGRFLSEAQIGMLGTQHPGVVKTLNYTMSPEPTIILPYLPGATLNELLEVSTKLPLPQALWLIYYLCEIESFLLDEHQVVHRDLKAENVMLIDTTDEPAQFPVVVFDLGLAKMIGASRSFTQQGSVVGSPCNVPPENLLGGPLSAKGEQFALGMLLMEMLLGEFPGDHASPLIEWLLNRILTPTQTEKMKRTAPAALPLVRKLLKEDPQDRFPNMRLLQSEVARLLMSLPASALSQSS